MENIRNARIEETLPNTFLTISDSPSPIDKTDESWCLENLDQDSISSHQLLDQSQPLDKLTSFNFNEIELDCECEPDTKLCDLLSNFESKLIPLSLPNLDLILEPTLIPVPVYYEIGSPILDGHIRLMDHEYEFRFFDFEPTLEQNPTLEPKFDFPEPILVPEPITLEPKSITSSSHILLLDQGVDNYDSEIIFQDWSYNRNSFMLWSYMILFTW